HKRILQVGHPQGVSLAEFLQAIALAREGRRKITLPVPLWPVEMAVGVAEGLGLPLPISSTNLKGLKIVERMDTQADMARLHLPVRSLDEMLGAEAESVAPSLTLRDRAVRAVLVGAGRIGLVHAVTLS